jgi:hypothetical protein
MIIDVWDWAGLDTTSPVTLDPPEYVTDLVASRCPSGLMILPSLRSMQVNARRLAS